MYQSACQGVLIRHMVSKTWEGAKLDRFEVADIAQERALVSNLLHTGSEGFETQHEALVTGR